MDDEDILKQCGPYAEDFKQFKTIIWLFRKVCDLRENIILEHEVRHMFNDKDLSNTPKILQIKVIQHYEVVGISCYSIYLSVWGIIQLGEGRFDIHNFTDHIHNIPYMPMPVLDLIQSIQLHDNDYGNWFQHSNGGKRINYVHPTVTLAKFKKQIVDKLNEDHTCQQLSKLNIVQEIQELKTENKKFQKEREYQCSELSSMQHSIHQLQEDMKQLIATTSKIQQDNLQLTKLLDQEKEKTKQLTETIQESQGLSFTHANTIGQALMSKSDIFNCM